ncbi:hypothetical protein Ddye_024252 [Dipteronia dyeriana]|uniref:Protein kinase domain-containing protein n=1 Tax=Dipteronia dyeriana TaxID=168575 RepID=A0AAD9TUI2_9ROSI|nr:hypothetical protein Ddye_024252 [Dipteronia dyeriana]
MYMLSAIASTVFVLALIFLLFRCQKKNFKPLDKEDVSALSISYQELERATNGFDEGTLLGRGGFGSVNKRKLLDGTTIEVKVFNFQVERALQSFNYECEVMRKICHRNLVKIIGSCSNIDFKALVLEYMANKSLKNGEDMVSCVCDFGIAKLLDEEDSMTQTHTLGTIVYMAPAICHGVRFQLSTPLRYLGNFRGNVAKYVAKTDYKDKLNPDGG